MDTIIPSNEYTEFEDRAYINPNLTVDETSSFIDNYRNIQNQNTQQINTQTQRLGTDVPTNIGGLTGAGSYFTSRYQKPQTASVIANLRTAAQAKALNDALANEQAMWKKRYQDAYNAYQKRSWDKSNTPTGTTIEGGIDYEDTDEASGLDAVQDINEYSKITDVYDSTYQANDSRATERGKNIEVTRDSNGNVSTIIINGTPSYGREARAKYRYLKNSGLVK